jgi:aryl-alcohol dehydrogenase-like predicted oxidoreductase
MEYTRLGDTGLKISRLALGCMSYGDPNIERAHRWALADEEAQPFFEQAIELGITFWDTANTYQAGTSEEVTGHAIRRYSRREDVVLATKVFGKMHDGPGGSGLSRKAIMEQIDASLTRLGTGYVDLYQIHRFAPAPPSLRPWRRCTTSSKPARSATWARRRCTPGSSPSSSTPPT